MKHLLIVATVIAFNTAAFADNIPGFVRITLDAAHRDALIEGAIWYPADAGGEPLVLGENAIFVGVHVREDAAVAEGRHPVVLLSHGLGGRFRTMAWLAAGLADRGAIVVSVNHTKSTTLDFDLRQAADHWTRVQDLRRALDRLLSDPRWIDSIDESRIMAAGFSFGGWTAMSMGGVTGNLAGYAAYCEKFANQGADCRDISRAGINLLALDAELWNAEDGRITAVAAIDPGLHHGLQAHNVTNLVDDVLLIGLGTGADRYLATDFSQSGSGFSALLPGAVTKIIAPASHFTALLTCKRVGAAILREEGEDPVCDEPEGTDRNAVHRRIVSLIAEQLGLGDLRQPSQTCGVSIGSPNCCSLAGLEPGGFQLGPRHRTKRGCNRWGDHLRPKSGSLSACSRRAKPRWRPLGDAYAKAKRLPIAAIACDELHSN